MSKRVILSAALLAIGVAGSAQAETDFGVRLIGVPHASAPRTVSNQTGDLPGAARVGGRFGRITSMIRSAAHNHAVGGVPNSYHLRGRAIDIARRPGITHAQIAAALRGAGYRLVESLDEGDHSHFAADRISRSISSPVAQSGWTRASRAGMGARRMGLI